MPSQVQPASRNQVTRLAQQNGHDLPRWNGNRIECPRCGAVARVEDGRIQVVGLYESCERRLEP